MKFLTLRWLCLFTIFLGVNSPWVFSNETVDLSAHKPDPIQVRLVNEEETIQPGRPFWVAVSLSHADKWHTYWKNPGDAGMASTINWSLPPGFTVSSIVWPTPDRFTVGGMVGYGYSGEILLLSQITPPATAPNGHFVDIGAQVRWLVCSDDFCVPGESLIGLSLPVTPDVPQLNAQASEKLEQMRAQIPKKHESTQVLRQQDHLEITLDLPELKEEVTSAYFCPEENSSIEHAVEPVVSRSEDSPKSYVVALKEDASNRTQTSLRGVLVLISETDEERSAYAFDVDSPIIDLDAGKELLSMADDVRSASRTNAQITPVLHDSAAAEFDGGLSMALLLAFIGGMILNLMPCVLPIISLKVFSFVKMSGKSRALSIKHGLAFSIGVLISFWVLAGALLTLQAYGRAVGWGFQLQDPLFIAILAAILFVLGLSLFGVFEVGAFVTTWAGKAQSYTTAGKQEGLTGSFFSGILATAVATPCTGPFLGSAVGFAFTVPAAQAMLIFTSLGLGMAFPYLLLSAFPQLLRFIPKPGAWMETFKQLMGFLMIATVLWLLWVFGAQTNTLAMTLLLAALAFLALASWIYGKWGSPTSSRRSRLISYAFAILTLAVSGYILVGATSSELIGSDEEITRQNAAQDSTTAWEPFSPERIEDLRRQGTPVIVDFTAKWCLICQANHLVLSTKNVQAKLIEKGVVRMKADWTRADPVITEALRKHGRNSVPLYLLYGTDPTQPPKILPQVLTADVVLEHLEAM